ncbi:hypothetical protein BJX65DRAFT_320691 [Aspergillus insuetus]
MPSTTRQWILKSKPTDLPRITGPSPTFELVTADLPKPTKSQAVLKTLFFSNDPAQRTWIDPAADPDRVYMDPVPIGAPMACFALAEVVESGSPGQLAVGSLVVTVSQGWTEYSVQEIEGLRIVQPISGLDYSHFLGALGFTGLTAYYGIKEVVGTTSEDTVVVSGAAGATGSMVVQLAKKIIGCKRVIGIAGSDEKCRWVETLGADVCINYKKGTFKEDLTKATEGFVEVFFDNVGGDILDFMFTRMKRNGRIAACGGISNYNSAEATGLRNFFEVTTMRIKIYGFIVIDYMHRLEEVVTELARAWQDGKIVIDDSMQTIIEARFEDVPSVWLKLFEGANVGKLCTRIVL